MTSLELARWQFGITTLYHFIFVPVTIGLATFTAYCQTRWYRTGEEHWLRATRFWGKLLLISFALGVATGIVQEFQFGMNWSDYSRFVGDIFGAPLAMEGLAAFFVESTFLGLWIFGWGKLSPGVHLACAWAVAGSTALSAYFILAANSWMQHPVGYDMHAGRARLTNIFDVLFNNTAIYAFVHTMLAALLTAGMLVIAVSAWHIRRGNEGAGVFGGSIRLALPMVAIAAFLQFFVGHFDGVLMSKQQPMKMSAADAVFETKDGAGLSLFATGDFKSNPEGLNRNVQIPNLLSWISTGYPRGEIKGVNDINREYRAKYGPGEYAPVDRRRLLDLARDDRHRGADVPGRRVRLVAAAPGTARAVAALPDLGGAGRHPAVRRLADGVDVHRDGAPAVGGLRAAEDRRRRIAEREHGRGADQPGRVHAALRRAGGDRRARLPAAPRARDRSPRARPRSRARSWRSPTEP